MAKKKKITDTEAPDEHELRRDRKFSLAEAIGRDNAELLKGASPVARGRQVLLEIEHCLENHLDDPDGSLSRTLLARLEDNPPLLARHFSSPLGALAELVNEFLSQEQALFALVRDTDARWGREYQEKPRFESEGQPPHADDPYTHAGVRSRLTDLRQHIEDEPGGTGHR